jgi:hypothetical protein
MQKEQVEGFLGVQTESLKISAQKLTYERAVDPFLSASSGRLLIVVKVLAL